MGADDGVDAGEDIEQKKSVGHGFDADHECMRNLVDLGEAADGLEDTKQPNKPYHLERRERFLHL